MILELFSYFAERITKSAFWNLLAQNISKLVPYLSLLVNGPRFTHDKFKSTHERRYKATQKKKKKEINYPRPLVELW